MGRQETFAVIIKVTLKEKKTIKMLLLLFIYLWQLKKNVKTISKEKYCILINLPTKPFFLKIFNKGITNMQIEGILKLSLDLNVQSCIYIAS